MKPFLLPLIFTVTLIAACGSSESTPPPVKETAAQIQQKKMEAQQKKVETLRYNELANRYYGQPFPFNEYDTIGRPQTLNGTDNEMWVVYFDKGDFTLINDKRTDTVRTVYLGKREF